ncbi:hypothetical protein [Halarchaeum sp. P4]|uniref:hypothetical protein n=1 Tax=Halarchaeum sp. P4 TaxID=3421639 RepID=UPI003EB929CC
MSRSPRAARSASVKCIGCNAPTTQTVEGDYVCVSCGETRIPRSPSSNAASLD